MQDSNGGQARATPWGLCGIRISMVVPLVRESAWLPLLHALPVWQPPAKMTVVLSPHPDDETLGAGGLIARLRSQGTPVQVLAATDGENAYEPLVPGLGAVREREQAEALARLGVAVADIARLRLPDSGLLAIEPKLVEAVAARVPRACHLIAPWPGDFHPDHEACGRAATAVAARFGLALTFYFFWTWHRGTPELLNGQPLVRLLLTPSEQQAKREALLCHHSQLHRTDGGPILPEDLLDPAFRPFEVFLPA